MGTTDKEALIELAERCEAATGPDIRLDREIGALLWREPPYFSTPNWQFQSFTASLDAAMTLAEPFMLVALSDIAADGLTGCCLCSDTSTNPPTEHWGIPNERSGSRQSILARAVCAAALRAQSTTLGENDGRE